MPGLFLGIMSGTSLDGADAVVADFSQPRPRTLGSGFVPFPAALRSRLLALCNGGDDGLDAVGACSIELADLYAAASREAMRIAGTPASEIEAIGCHGQTVRHRPDRGYTLQVNDPARLAERTGITVVADFRRRDIAAGGQGAPLVPVFHEAVFRDPSHRRAIVNIGGISNATWLAPSAPVLGFDCGPGNVLLDAWAERHLARPYDEDGRWATQGSVLPDLLARFLAEPFLARRPPKSTGRELFDRSWLESRIGPGMAAVDVQATLLEFTATCVVDALGHYVDGVDEIHLCGGGARNGALAARIAALAAPRPVRLTDALGVPTGHVEALAFAWFAMKCLRREALDLTAITGAAHACVLGAIYPA